MVSDLKVKDKQVSFTIGIDHNDSEIKSKLNFSCIESIQKIYPDAEVHIHLNSNVANTVNTSPLPQVKNVIAVASGKGGVGKSTVSSNIALSLYKMGYKVGMMDADLYGPSQPTIFGVKDHRPKVKEIFGKHKLIPIETKGIHLISLGNIIEPQQAVVLRGPRLGGIVKQFVNETVWPDLDFLIIDLPPGTGDIQLTLVQTLPLTGTIMVTTPQELAVIDAIKAMNMFLLPSVNVPILGVIENMSWFTPAELPDNKYLIFGEGGGRRLADLAKVELLGQIPLSLSMREANDEGRFDEIVQEESIGEVFNRVARNVVESVNVRNNTVDPTQVVKMER